LADDAEETLETARMDMPLFVFAVKRGSNIDVICLRFSRAEDLVDHY
jgi:hypothetical protein